MSKNSRMRGRRTHGHGSQKKARGAGGRGGRGFAGSFKHKKLWVKKYYPERFDKKKFKSLREKNLKPTLKTINLRDIRGDVELKGYKVLAVGETGKFTVKASAFSAKAKEKLEKAGGKAVVFE